ncbi:MAG: hypothetical protein AB4038_01640 [Prochloraceae cyanobacterium]
MKLKIFVVIAIALTSATAVGLAPVASAQKIIESVGEVLVKRGNSEYRPIGTGARLQSDDLLQTAPGAIVKILCENSTLWRVPAGTTSSVNSGCPIIMVRVVKGETRYRPGGSDSRIPYILYPRMTYLLDDRPTFRWNPVAGATSYAVRLLGPGGVEWQTEVSSTEVVYLDDASPLDWGVKYLVTVKADNGSCSLQDRGGNLGFELLDEDTIQEVEEKAAKIEELEDRTEEERALTLAEMYRREKLTAKAIATLEALVEQGSQTALVFRKLGDLYAGVGLNRLAEDRYERASELFASTSDRYALIATRDGLARAKLMLEKKQQAEQLSAEVIAEYRQLGDEQSATALEERFAEPSPEKEQPETADICSGSVSKTQIITPGD